MGKDLWMSLELTSKDIVKTLYWTGVKEAGIFWLDSTPSLSPGNWNQNTIWLIFKYWNIEHSGTCQKGFQSILQHHLDKLIVVQLAVPILMRSLFIEMQRRRSELSKKLNVSRIGKEIIMFTELAKKLLCFQNWQRNYYVFRIVKEIIMFSVLAKKLLCLQNCQRN